MKQKDILYLTPKQLKDAYKKQLPNLWKFAQESASLESFKEAIKNYISRPEYQETAASKTMHRLLSHDGKPVFDLSTEQQVAINTFAHIYHFLTSDITEDQTSETIVSYHPHTHMEKLASADNVATDLFIDFFFQWMQLDYPVENTLTKEQAFGAMKRWPTSMSPEVETISKQNKARMIPLLIAKVAKRTSGNSKYYFTENMNEADKIASIENWWNDYLFQLAMAVRSPEELNLFLGHSLSKEMMNLLLLAKEKGIPTFATPYYLTLLNTGMNGYDDNSVRSYILYSRELVETFGEIRAWEKEDIVEAGKPNAAGWILPGHNIHRRYPEVAILIPDTVGRACGGLCASCQRMYDFQSGRLNFNLKDLQPKETWAEKLTRLMDFYENDPQLKDILITGGDALMSSTRSLKGIFDAVIKMAERKREANTSRLEGEKYAEMKRVRLGSRLLAYLPMRIDKELVEALRDFRIRGEKAGIERFVIQTHFQSPLEITPQAAEAVRMILDAGWYITNQLVYTVAASRLGHTTQLRHELNKIGILTYYTFSVKGFRENHAVFTPIARSMHEQKQEKVYGKLEEREKTDLFNRLYIEKENPRTALNSFMQEFNVPFLATDRNVLNLPAIGKSMTFKLIGYKPSGERILEFDHDHTRLHSPIINQLGRVNITENKSLSAYLRQLDGMDEDISLYEDIWQYNEGSTEKVFELYKLG